MWIDKNTGETASNLETRLILLGAEVAISNHIARTIAYSANGILLRQKETVSTSEFRGLTKEAADLLVTLSSDSTSNTTYYKAIGTSEYAVAIVMSGLKTDYSASRANEADAWHVTKVVTTYDADNVSGWSTNRPSVSTNGCIVSQHRSKTFLSFGIGGVRVYQNEACIVREYPFLSLEEASSKVSSLSSSGSYVYDEKIATSWSSSEGVTAWKNVTVRGGANGSTSHGTDVVTDMRYEGAERLWTVTATSTEYWGSSS